MRAVIRKGDKTTHGGVVIEGVEDYKVLGLPVARKGHMVVCPLCKGTYPIVEGTEKTTVDGGFPVALEGMKTACGAELIASQSVFKVE